MTQVVAVAPEMSREGDVTRVATYTSDLIELVSGLCPVTSCKLFWKYVTQMDTSGLPSSQCLAMLLHVNSEF